MPFVKLDCGILNSTLWFAREAREVFITALLMAELREFTSSQPQIEVRTLALTGWCVPPGWYGFIPAAGIGIVRRAGVDLEAGIVALELLGSPEASSRSQDHEGRRLVRIDGGYVVLNYMRYRERDYTSAERSRRYRLRVASRRRATASHRDITQSDITDVTDPDRTGEDQASSCDSEGTISAPPSASPETPVRWPDILTPTPARPRPTQSDGANPPGARLAYHRGHAWCAFVDGAYRGMCVPAGVHGQFVGQVGGDPDAADATLRAWYLDVLRAIPATQPIGDNVFDFWRAHFTAKFGQVAPPPPTANERRRQLAEQTPLGTREDDIS